jgi:hypothetical protein
MNLRTASLVAAAVAAPAMANITISVTPASAPNAFGSPSYASWYGNAVYAIENSLSTYGAAGPSQYNVAPAVMDYRDNFVTSFNSWRADVNPGTSYGPGYASELGNRLAFGLHITGSAGETFSISQLSFTGQSSEPGNSLGFSFGLGAYNYSDQYVGINYGGNGVKGGGDDLLITSGANTQLVHEIVGRGSGNAWWPQVPADGATPQEAIDNVAAYLSQYGAILFSGTYTLLENANPIAMGSGGVTFIPAPGSAALLGAGGLVALRRRRRN